MSDDEILLLAEQSVNKLCVIAVTNDDLIAFAREIGQRTIKECIKQADNEASRYYDMNATDCGLAMLNYQQLLKDHFEMVDTGIDRGAWSDVPDVTQWVDELRGDDDLEEPPNSTTGFVEPVAWGMQNADGQITDVITPKEHARVEGSYTVPLYTAPPDVRKNRITEWQGLTDEDIIDLQKASWVDNQAFEAVAWMIDEYLEKKNT